MNWKIIIFEDERYNRINDYVPFGCAWCKLTPEQRVWTCMNWCYDEIIKKEKTQKTEIDIINSVQCQKTINETITKLNNILWLDNIGLK